MRHANTSGKHVHENIPPHDPPRKNRLGLKVSIFNAEKNSLYSILHGRVLVMKM